MVPPCVYLFIPNRMYLHFLESDNTMNLSKNRAKGSKRCKSSESGLVFIYQYGKILYYTYDTH